MAMIAYVGLGVLSWTTVTDQRFRLATLFVLAMFALKTWVRRHEVLHSDSGSDSK